jgi:hypothetical protein
MPTQLDGVSVTVSGNSAFVYYISPTQIEAVGKHEKRRRERLSLRGIPCR